MYQEYAENTQEKGTYLKEKLTKWTKFLKRHLITE